MNRPYFLLSLLFLIATSTAANMIERYRSKMTCLFNQPGEMIHTIVLSIIPCTRIPLLPEGQNTAPSAFSAYISGSDTGVVPRLFDDTHCTGSTPDLLSGNRQGKCAPQSLSGAGWMSFSVETAKTS
jgi:hypothetical protein